MQMAGRVFVWLTALAVTAGCATAVPGGGTGAVTYTQLSETEAPPAVGEALNQMREQPGNRALVVDGVTYVLITAGEKPTGGYQVQISDVNEVGGRIVVNWRLSSPAPGTMTTQALTYPYSIIKFNNRNNLPVAVDPQ